MAWGEIWTPGECSLAIRITLNHKTTYCYDRLVSLSPHIIRLRPAPHCRTPILSYALTVRPQPHFLNWQQDPQSNYLARVVFPEKTRQLYVEVDLVADMAVINAFDFFLEPSAQKYPFLYESWLARDLTPYLETTPAGPKLREWLHSVPRTETNTIDFLVQLNQRLQQEIHYIIRLEPGIQSCDETLTLRQGSCRDRAWLLVQILRHLGLAARFVSGYLIQLVADVQALDGPSGPKQDFTDLHAWAEVYLPGAGWVGLDPTSGLLAGEGHIPLACTPDASSAAPITGGVDKCEGDFGFTMSVTRLHEDPRVTKPYTEAQWQEIDALGRRIDADLVAGDVRLTMGGEPTFVSIDDMDGAEWNTAALGPTKRHLAADLLKRLKVRFAPGGMLHYGQGKWYPGESLPRWTLACYWRQDGMPLWVDEALLADETIDYGYTAAEAQRFIVALAERLEVEAHFVLPAYEDVWHYLRQERQLPVNVDPLQANLADPEERARLSRTFERGLEQVVGYVLPLDRRRFSPTRWVTGPWPLRQARLFLLAGDSPIGLRLPLDALPWMAPESYPQLYEPDPLVVQGPLPEPPQMLRQPVIPAASGAPRPTGVMAQSLVDARMAVTGHMDMESAPLQLAHGAPTPAEARTAGAEDVRTALCVEPRQGRLYVFLPPTRALEDYVDLVAAVEDTAAALRTPVVLEGYPPPFDYRLKQLQVTPDPGVIEVNIHPAHSWDELVANITGLYEDARQACLGTEKFMLDGRHTGTGGGNHVVIGGPSPADSPLLRRPDLLRSLLGYWHNHPSLSYLFSGLFIGPTSQAPRVDEGRHDSLYELEIAFQQLPDRGECPPWLVDRVFRHLLVDVPGNTHRTEFCIDKLYAPDSSNGRLGLLELRAFEMPPHTRMSLTQQLLLRALIARFWTTPYRQTLVRWGTALHDRFMLPHFVLEDFRDVLDDLQRAGYPFQAAWFAPHCEFRSPLYGSITQNGITLELRSAIEPWYVLGEEPGASGTVRFVDSSVERLQVKVTGMTETRHAVTCNGRRVPLQPTGTAYEFVAGVRYRAWQPATCLHPTIPVHTPLVFDLVDTWNGRSIAGCTYHVAHPGGRHYTTFPVNAYEAEGRRLARFFPFGHTPGPMSVLAEAAHPQFPCTLDLRQQRPWQADNPSISGLCNDS
jgi:uncharacterized protein (DUF2126 family)/transglutaminase-like putative cysteine protease